MGLGGMATVQAGNRPRYSKNKIVAVADDQQLTEANSTICSLQASKFEKEY